jgi:hypothetical protein
LQTLILFVAAARRRRPAVRLTLYRRTRSARLYIVRGYYIIVVVEMKVLIFRVSARSGVRDLVRVVH